MKAERKDVLMQASQLNRGEKDDQEQDNQALNKVIEQSTRTITNTAHEYNTRVL